VGGGIREEPRFGGATRAEAGMGDAHVTTFARRILSLNFDKGRLRVPVIFGGRVRQAGQRSVLKLTLLPIDDDFDYMPFPTLPTSESQPSTQTTVTSSHQASNFMPPTATLRAIQPSSASSDSASPSPLSPRSGKRKASIAATPPSTDGLDDLSRVAAEEDKRRRNTAASARFRVKKKQREQALERTAKEMTDRVKQLEAKIAQLEMENQWLKNLIVEKNTATAASNDSDNSRESSKDGAGTKLKNSES